MKGTLYVYPYGGYYFGLYNDIESGDSFRNKSFTVNFNIGSFGEPREIPALGYKGIQFKKIMICESKEMAERAIKEDEQ